MCVSKFVFVCVFVCFCLFVCVSVYVCVCGPHVCKEKTEELDLQDRQLKIPNKIIIRIKEKESDRRKEKDEEDF